MTQSASVSLLGSEFNDFLFASIGEDGNGMLLSVLSALARLDVDPWQEAASLARLPGAVATRRLASLLAALPEGPSARQDSGTIAARLVALLPHGAGPNLPSRGTAPGVAAATHSRSVMFTIFINVIFIALMMGAQYVIASRQRSAHLDAPAPASSTVIPQTPLPSSDR